MIKVDTHAEKASKIFLYAQKLAHEKRQTMRHKIAAASARIGSTVTAASLGAMAGTLAENRWGPFIGGVLGLGDDLYLGARFCMRRKRDKQR